jgi:hypothetical protein
VIHEAALNLPLDCRWFALRREKTDLEQLQAERVNFGEDAV